MEELILNYINNYKNNNLSIKDIFMNYKNEFLKDNQNINNKINYVLMNVFIKSNDNNLKITIANYFYNYIHGVLRSDTGEARFNELEKIYNLIISEKN